MADNPDKPQIFFSATAMPETLGNCLYFAVLDDQLLVPEDFARQPQSLWQPLPAELEVGSRHYLGHYRGQHCVAVELKKNRPLPAGMICVSLYQLLVVLEPQLLSIAGRAIQVLAWDRDHRYCGRCGTQTTLLVEEDERARQCPECTLRFYPRLSPCIIVLVARGEELLLAHGVRHPPKLYSLLAGFVEPGETVEETVHREVYEEVGLQVRSVDYFSSQSWPFPNQLMLGFFAEYKSGTLKPDPNEIADAGWWHYSDLPEVPGEYTISGQLIGEKIRRYR